VPCALTNSTAACIIAVRERRTRRSVAVLVVD
jgi:hypothetical protein